LKRAFVNPADGRLRAGWRILIFLATFIGLSVLGQTIVKAIFGGIPKTTTFLRNSIVIIIAALAASIAVPTARQFLDRKSFISLGLKLNSQTAKDLIFGFLLSGLMAASIFFIMKVTGLIEVTGINWGSSAPEDLPMGSLAAYLAVVSLGSLVLLFLMDVIIGWWEELVFRGYLLQNFIEGMGLTLAVVVSCLIYGLVHATGYLWGCMSVGIFFRGRFLVMQPAVSKPPI